MREGRRAVEFAQAGLEGHFHCILPVVLLFRSGELVNEWCKRLEASVIRARVDFRREGIKLEQVGGELFRLTHAVAGEGRIRGDSGRRADGGRVGSCLGVDGPIGAVLNNVD